MIDRSEELGAGRLSCKLALQRGSDRIVRTKVLPTRFGWLGVDQHEGEHAWLRAIVDPRVHGAALDDDIALGKVHGLTVVKFQVAFTGQQDRVIQRLCAVHELG